MNITVEPKNRLQSIWGIVAFLISLIIMSIITGFIAMIILKMFKLDVSTNLPYVAPTSGFLAGLIVTKFAIDAKKWTFADIGIKISSKWVFDSICGFIGAVVISLIVVLIIHMLGGIQFKKETTGATKNVVFGLFYFITVALNEELVFRGFLLRFILTNYSKWSAIISTSVLFSLVHFWNPGISSLNLTYKITVLFGLMVSGIFLGLLLLKYGGLAVPIGFHTAWNWLQGNILGFPVSGIKITGNYLTPSYTNHSNWLTGGIVGLEGSAVTIGLMILLVGWIVIRTHKLENISITKYKSE